MNEKVKQRPILTPSFDLHSIKEVVKNTDIITKKLQNKENSKENNIEITNLSLTNNLPKASISLPNSSSSLSTSSSVNTSNDTRSDQQILREEIILEYLKNQPDYVGSYMEVSQIIRVKVHNDKKSFYIDKKTIMRTLLKLEKEKKIGLCMVELSAEQRNNFNATSYTNLMIYLKQLPKKIIEKKIINNEEVDIEVETIENVNEDDNNLSKKILNYINSYIHSRSVYNKKSLQQKEDVNYDDEDLKRIYNNEENYFRVKGSSSSLYSNKRNRRRKRRDSYSDEDEDEIDDNLYGDDSEASYDEEGDYRPKKSLKSSENEIPSRISRRSRRKRGENNEEYDDEKEDEDKKKSRFSLGYEKKSSIINERLWKSSSNYDQFSSSTSYQQHLDSSPNLEGWTHEQDLLLLEIFIENFLIRKARLGLPNILKPIKNKKTNSSTLSGNAPRPSSLQYEKNIFIISPWKSSFDIKYSDLAFSALRSYYLSNSVTRLTNHSNSSCKRRIVFLLRNFSSFLSLFSYILYEKKLKLSKETLNLIQFVLNQRRFYLQPSPSYDSSNSSGSASSSSSALLSSPVLISSSTNPIINELTYRSIISCLKYFDRLKSSSFQLLQVLDLLSPSSPPLFQRKLTDDGKENEENFFFSLLPEDQLPLLRSIIIVLREFYMHGVIRRSIFSKNKELKKDSDNTFEDEKEKEEDEKTLQVDEESDPLLSHFQITSIYLNSVTERPYGCYFYDLLEGPLTSYSSSDSLTTVPPSSAPSSPISSLVSSTQTSLNTSKDIIIIPYTITTEGKSSSKKISNILRQQQQFLQHLSNEELIELLKQPSEQAAFLHHILQNNAKSFIHPSNLRENNTFYLSRSLINLLYTMSSSTFSIHGFTKKNERQIAFDFTVVNELQEKISNSFMTNQNNDDFSHIPKNFNNNRTSPSKTFDSYVRLYSPNDPENTSTTSFSSIHETKSSMDAVYGSLSFNVHNTSDSIREKIINNTWDFLNFINYNNRENDLPWILSKEVYESPTFTMNMVKEEENAIKIPTNLLNSENISPSLLNKEFYFNFNLFRLFFTQVCTYLTEVSSINAIQLHSYLMIIPMRLVKLLLIQLSFSTLITWKISNSSLELIEEKMNKNESSSNIQTSTLSINDNNDPFSSAKRMTKSSRLLKKKMLLKQKKSFKNEDFLVFLNTSYYDQDLFFQFSSLKEEEFN